MRVPTPIAIAVLAIVIGASALFGPWLARPSQAMTADAVIARILDQHVLARYAALTEGTGALARAAGADCAPDTPALRDAYHAAFDAWIGVSHLTAGPAEEDNRYFALAFWPDTRSMTPRSLAALIADADPAVDDPDAFAAVSVAARGFYALEYLLFDPQFDASGAPGYHCRLVRAVAADIDATATDLRAAWETGFAPAMRAGAAGTRFADPRAALQFFYGALDHGLEFTADLRLGRPLGSYERPRPQLAEARRAGRSLRHVVLSLEGLRELAGLLAIGLPALNAALDDRFARVIDQARALDDPDFAGVADPQARFRIEALQQSVHDLRDFERAELGPALGVASGFNALDGD